MDRLNKGFENLWSAWKMFLSPLNIDESNLVFNLLVRWIIFAGILFRISLTWFRYEPPINYVWIGAIVVLFSYASYLTWSTVWRSKLKQDEGWYFRQVIFDTAIFSVFYWLTQVPNSDFFLFYFLPLLTIANYFEKRRAFGLFICVSVAFAIVMVGLSLSSQSENISIEFIIRDLVIRDLLPRWTFFIVIPYFAFLQSKKLRKQADELRFVHETALNVALKRGLNERLDDIAQGATSLLGAEGCKVYLPTKLGDGLELVKFKGPMPEHLAQGYVLPLDQGIAGWVYREKQPCCVNDYANSEFAVPDLIEVFERVLEVPLMFGDKAIGVLGVFDKANRRKFKDDDIPVLERLARHAAVAIYEMQLYEEKENQTNLFKALSTASKAINENLDVDDTLVAIAEEVMTLIEKKDPSCFIHIGLFQEGNQLNYIDFESNNKPAKVQAIIDLDSKEGKVGISGRSVMLRKLQNVPDVLQDHDYLEARDYVNSQLSIPLLIQERVIGVLSVEHPEPDAFTRADEKNLLLLASLAAVAIDNAQIFEDYSELALMDLHRSIANHAIGGKSITIKTSLINIKEALNKTPVLSADAMGEITDNLHDIEIVAQKIYEFNREIPPPSMNSAESIKINGWLKKRQSSFYDTVGCEVELDLALADSTICWMSLDWLDRVCDILLTNSKGAMVDIQAKKLLTIKSYRKNKYAVITFTDTGKGFPNHVRRQMFHRRIRDSSGGGSGRGLLMAALILGKYEGKIELLSPGPKDTTTAVYLPIRES